MKLRQMIMIRQTNKKNKETMPEVKSVLMLLEDLI